ncbi:MAG: signal peptidase II [Phycisphaeraceae bacterium]|nr:MAG: signal peptidase II [Phycisphaeraceae bacterium]
MNTPGPTHTHAAPGPGPAGSAPRTGPAERPAWRSRGAWAVLVVVFALGLWADLWTKAWAFRVVPATPYVFTKEDVLEGRALPPRGEIVVIERVLEFKLVLNQGAVFGAGQGRRWFFIGVTIFAITFAVWLFATWTRARDRAAHAALGLLLAGGVGNLYDRITFACVRDFIHPLPGVRWPGSAREVWPYVSNVADAFLIVGIGVLLIHVWRHGSRTGHPPTSSPSPSPADPGGQPTAPGSSSPR